VWIGGAGPPDTLSITERARGAIALGTGEDHSVSSRG
jgi:hypothetical protein